MSKRTIIMLVLLTIVAITLPLAVYLVQQQQELRGQAAPATTLSFSPSSAQATVGNPVSVDLQMNTGSNQVTAAEIFVTFDATLFQTSPAPRIEAISGGSLPVVLVTGNVSGGTASITVGANPGTPAQGTGLPIARLTFTGTRNGTSPLTISSNTRIAGITEGSNVLSSSTPGSITVSGGASPTATPTPTPPPGGAPTATPTPTGTIPPTATPTPTGTTGGDGTGGACTTTRPAGAPTLTSVTAATNSAVLVWTAAKDPVTHYGVVYGLAAGEERFGALNIGDKNIRTYTVENLSGGTTYFFKVKAFNGCAQSDASNEISATPTGGAVSGPATGFTAITPSPTPTIAQPTPTPIAGKGGELIVGKEPPGDISSTTVFIGIGTFLLLLGGMLLFL